MRRNRSILPSTKGVLGRLEEQEDNLRAAIAIYSRQFKETGSVGTNGVLSSLKPDYYEWPWTKTTAGIRMLDVS